MLEYFENWYKFHSDDISPNIKIEGASSVFYNEIKILFSDNYPHQF